MLSRIFAVVDALSRLAGALSVLLVVGIAVLIVTEIVCRFAFNLSLSFAWEYSAYFLGIAIFCGAAFTLRTGGHVRVSFLTAATPAAATRIVELACTIFGVGVAGFLAYALSHFAWRSFVTGSTSATIDATPLVIPQSGLALGAILLAAQLVVRLARLLLNQPPEDATAMESYSVE